jgi:drug/metabolite transporter (DMT)-like permease
MIFLRVVGIVIALAGAALLVFSVLNGTDAVTGVSQSLAAFAMIGGLLMAMAADAGAKLSRKQQEAAQKKADAKKPKQGA